MAFKKWGMASLLISMVFALAACGGGSTSTSSSTGGAAQPESPAVAKVPTSGCGSYPSPPATDPDGVLASLGADYQKAYAGYSPPVRKSAWSDWKPGHAGPYKVAVQWNAVTTDFQKRSTELIKEKLEASPLVSDVTLQTTGNNLDVAAEIQQLDQLIQSKPDLLIVQPLTAPAFTRQINAAAAAGIPTIVAMDSDSKDTANAVNIQPNAYLGGATTGAAMLRLLDGKGSYLMGRTLASTGVDIDTVRGFNDALKRCPDAKVLGSIYGAFTTAGSKTETLKFLGTHPQKIDGVLDVANQAAGIMSAFQQSGRPMPPVTQNGPQAGAMTYWDDHKDSYQTVGYGFSATALADTVSGVALRMLDGQGIKVTDITNSPPLITQSNFSEWLPKVPQPLGSSLESEGPPNSFTSEAYLNGLFNSGSTPASK